MAEKRRPSHVRLDLGHFVAQLDDSQPSPPPSPLYDDMSSPLLSGWGRSPPSSPFVTPPAKLRLSRRLACRPRRLAALVALAVVATIVLFHARERPVVQRARQHAERLAQRVGRRRKTDPFLGLQYEEAAGELVYPAVSTPASSPGEPSLDSQPHPIHYLMREAEAAWEAKVSRQSQTLEEAVAEYERRYRQPPPRGFDKWFNFAQSNGVQLLDEYDSIHARLQPFAALRPSVLRERNLILQNVSQWDVGQTFWMHPLTVTIKVSENGSKVEAEGPMRHENHRSDQVMALLEGIAQFLPDLNMTITGHDVPWVVLSGEHKQMHVDAAERGECASASVFSCSRDAQP